MLSTFAPIENKDNSFIKDFDVARGSGILLLVETITHNETDVNMNHNNLTLLMLLKSPVHQQAWHFISCVGQTTWIDAPELI